VKQEKVMKRVSSKRKVSSKVEGKTSSGEETDKPTTSQKRKLNNDVIRKAKKRKEDTEHINSTTANIRRSCRNTRSIKSHSETKEQILNEIGSKTDSYEHKKQPKKTSAKEKMTMSKQRINISDKGKVDAIEGKGDVERLQPDKRETLNKVDSSIRKDFLKLGFARWGKSWLPIIQLGPYDVAPGPVRDTWMNFFLNTQKRPRLVYWYGSSKENLSKSFSFLSKGAIISVEEGDIKGYSTLPPRLTKKLTSEKKLTAKEKLILNGLREIKEELQLSKANRVSWLK